MKGPGAGFTTIDREVELDDLPVEGAWPPWLAGTLLRNGPGRFEVGPDAYRHWFDGLALLHRFAFAGGRVRYSSRFLQSGSYREAMEAGRISRAEFATDPCRSLFKRLFTFFTPKFTDNASVSITCLADRVVALSETPLPVAFDPETLETAGVVDYKGEVAGHLTTAHPHLDPGRGELVNYVTRFGRRSRYHVYRIPRGTRRRMLLGSVAVREPAYMHSFGLTERYVVLAEFPFVVNPLRLLRPGRPFIENYRWKPERGVRFLLFSREDGRLAATCEADPFFAFHHVNAFEAGDEVVVDLVTYRDPGIIRRLYLEEVRGSAILPETRLVRYRLPRAGGRARAEALTDAACELPRIHYRACNTRAYRYVYGIGVHQAANFTDQLVKVNVGTGAYRSWRAPDCYPGEPVFVPAPEARREDDGVVLSVVLDAAAGTSFLLVLDAVSFEERARARVPHPIPFGFHGQYLAPDDPSAQLHR